ncbi:MAG TPA: hypothetical protein PKM94_05610, partial [candidate division Zixibacteria bacterium]|nr:hypothetical protein [candidate division Zixibacteria bacterium]
MAERANGKPTWVERRIPAIGAIVLAVAVGVYAWIGISESRKDSLGLLVTQGAAFTEALAFVFQAQDMEL